MTPALLNFLKKLSPDEAFDLAARCHTTTGYLKQVAYGNRRVRESLAINIERETGGAVSCEELRPDVDWAYIRNSVAPAPADAA